MHLITPEPFSEETLIKAKKLRTLLDIPECLDTPFFIARFLRANDGDEEITIRKISEYMIHRKILAYSQLDNMQIFTQFPMGKATFERFCISNIDYNIRSKDVHVFIQKMEGLDLKEVMKAIPLSYVVHSYFMLQETFGRTIAHTEKITGRPSSVVCILDLSGLNISDYINPLSSNVKLARLAVKVWSDYFSENMCKLLIINPPGIVSLMWQVTRHIMDSATAARVAFLHDVSELKNYLEPQAIPVEYGGEWRDDSGYAIPAESCCHPYKTVMEKDYRNFDEIWIENGILKPPAPKKISVKAYQQEEVIRKTNENGLLIWNFTVSGDVEFEILKKEAGKEITVWPKITLTSLKLPEYGAILVSPGEYCLRFINSSNTWFPLKISLSTDIISR